MSLNLFNKTITEKDIIASATEACDAYQQALEAGYKITCLENTIQNISFCRDIIQDHGAEWFVKNCDPQNLFLKQYGEVSVAAAEEGLSDALKTMWEKIKEFFTKIVAITFSITIS